MYENGRFEKAKSVEVIDLANHGYPLQRPFGALRVRIGKRKEVASHVGPAKGQNHARVQAGGQSVCGQSSGRN